ncbi:MAG: STAS domain-containing protein [bacterium]
MFVTGKQIKDIGYIAIEGDVNYQTIESVRGEIIETMAGLLCKKAIINLENVGLVDSSGIGLLMNLNKYFKRGRGVIAICNVPARLQKLFDQMFVGAVIKIYPTVKDAFQALESGH